MHKSLDVFEFRSESLTMELAATEGLNKINFPSDFLAILIHFFK